jgi:hypothetical protein
MAHVNFLLPHLRPLILFALAVAVIQLSLLMGILSSPGAINI